MYDKSSYRQCVGITVFNPDGNIWIGKRSNISGRKRIWQMPQGGINDGEIPLDAAKRELFEAMSRVSETGKGPRKQFPSMGCSIKWR